MDDYQDTSMTFPDWNKIGRRVGKKLRDIIKTPAKTGPSAEERLAKRLGDARRGLVYFDNFDELEAWSPEDVDPLQRSNTPLLKRSGSHTHDHFGPTTVLSVCHDYSGGYHDYESVRPCLRDDRMYACNYPQYVDTLIYFSHKLVCVPPPTWINTMHRNGVKVLGTFIVEPGKAHVERMLTQVDDRFITAQQLAAMADIFSFDGWLLNIELEFNKDSTDKICMFIRSLKRLIPEGKVVWCKSTFWDKSYRVHLTGMGWNVLGVSASPNLYQITNMYKREMLTREHEDDALNTDNEVDYQNGLTMKNAPFAIAADSLFTNYRWTRQKLEEAHSTGARCGLHPRETSFGIDVWAQNTDMPGPPRITFPPNGGGGTNTGLGLEVLAEAGFSTAIFGPAWTHEHFSTSATHGLSTSERVEHAMWQGECLPFELGCDCHQGRPHHTQEYVRTPIVHHAREFPAGSAHFFETDFHGAFERVAHPQVEDKNFIRPTLGSQGPLPHLLPMSVPEWQQASTRPRTRVLYGQLVDEPCGGIIVNTKIIGIDDKTVPFRAHSLQKTQLRLCLFKLSILRDRSPAAHIRFRWPEPNMDAASGFYMGYEISKSEKLHYVHAELSPCPDQVREQKIILSFPTAESRLVEFGVFLVGLIEYPKPLALCQIFNLSIRPRNQVESSWTIHGITLTERGNSSDSDRRLAWKCSGSDDLRLTGLPWSTTTGPFSHFGVMVDGKECGRAYCTEFPIHREDFRGCEGDMVEVCIRGRLFGGGEIASLPLQLPRNKMWVL